MKLTAHLGTISWSLADKLLYVAYGIVQLQQINALGPVEYGLFSLLLGLNTWIMIVTDGSALQGIIQFGVRHEERPRVHIIAAALHCGIVGTAVALIFALQGPLSDILYQPRFASVASMLPLFALLSIPRQFCLKLLYRDMRMKELFIADAVWFGSRTILTFWLFGKGASFTFEDIILIDFSGMGMSSAVSVWLTRRQLTFGRVPGIALKDYLRFGVPLAVATGLNSIPRQLDVLIIQSFFGTATVGVYNSAKTFYRLYEQAFDAAVTLMNSAAVRMVAQRRIDDLRILATKGISFTLVPTILSVVLIQLGAGSAIVWILPKFGEAVGHFTVLSLAALAQPLMLMSTIMMAMGRNTDIVRFSAVAMVSSLATLIVIGYLGWEHWIGLGMVANNLIIGLLCVAFVRREIQFPWKLLLRAFADISSAVQRLKTKVFP